MKRTVLILALAAILALTGCSGTQPLPPLSGTIAASYGGATVSYTPRPVDSSK